MKIFNRMIPWKITAILAILMLAVPLLSPLVAQEKGLQIIKEAIQRDNGYGNSRVDLEMVLKNSHGQESHRYIKTRNLEVPGDGDKLLTVFNRPKDVKGTALLSFTHQVGDDDQWLYLPALRRVKRISSGNKSGSFMGSEFAFEDLASEELEKYTSYKYLKNEPCGELACFVIERIPANKKSGYKRQMVWIDDQEYRFMKIEYYDRKNDLLKTRIYKNYQQYLDKFWRPSEMTMENHQSGKSTILFFKNLEFQVGLTARDFDRNSLKRAR